MSFRPKGQLPFLLFRLTQLYSHTCVAAEDTAPTAAIFEMNLEANGKYRLITKMPKYNAPSAYVRPLKV